MNKYYIFIVSLGIFVVVLIIISGFIINQPIKENPYTPESTYVLPSRIPTPTLMTPIEAQNEVLNATCSGEIKDDLCIQVGCMYSYPIDIYKKGKAVDVNGNIFYDQCLGINGNMNQVMKQYCEPREYKSTDYIHGARTFECQKGCQDGACIK